MQDDDSISDERARELQSIMFREPADSQAYIDARNEWLMGSMPLIRQSITKQIYTLARHLTVDDLLGDVIAPVFKSMLHWRPELGQWKFYLLASVHIRTRQAIADLVVQTTGQTERRLWRRGVQAWRQQHPGGSQEECATDLGIDVRTVRPNWSARMGELPLDSVHFGKQGDEDLADIIADNTQETPDELVARQSDVEYLRMRFLRLATSPMERAVAETALLFADGSKSHCDWQFSYKQISSHLHLRGKQVDNCLRRLTGKIKKVVKQEGKLLATREACMSRRPRCKPVSMPVANQ